MKYINVAKYYPIDTQRFKHQDLYDGMGTQVSIIIDTFRELSENSRPRILGNEINYRIVKQVNNPTFEESQRLKAIAEEMNDLAVLHQYLNNH